MSSPEREEIAAVGKYVKRVKRGSPSPQRPVSESAGDSAPSPTQAIITPVYTSPPAPTVPLLSLQDKVLHSMDSNHEHPYAFDRYEKAKALFAKYGFTLDACDWHTAARMPVERVQKAIRIRVRYTCHRCQNIYGADRHCVSCQHRKCTKCTRYPPKKSGNPRAEDAKEISTTTKPSAAASILPGPNEATSHSPQSPNPGVTKSGLGHKAAMQTPRSTCHQCSSTFKDGEEQCATCQHMICSECSRDPVETYENSNDDIGQNGTPYDEVERSYKEMRARVKYTCHQCNNIFKDRDSMCNTCSHERCNECVRNPPKKMRLSIAAEQDQGSIAESLSDLSVDSPTIEGDAVVPP